MPLADPLVIQNPQRVEKLRSLVLLDTPADPAFDRLTRLACKILKAPISLITLVDADREYFKSHFGLEKPLSVVREIPLTHSFCQHVVANSQALIVEDTREHPLVCDNPVIHELNIISYIGMPLMTKDGFAVGSFCVMDKQPRRWTDSELDILSELSQSVMTEIALQNELLERQKTEAALRENQLFVQRIFRTIPDAVYVLDVNDQQNIYSNESVRRLLGFAPDQPVEQTTIQSLIHPQDILPMLQHLEQLQYGTDNDVFEIEYRMKDARDEWRWINTRNLAFKRSYDGTVSQIIGVAQDITARKQADEALRESQHLLQGVLDATPDFIYIYDLLESRNVFVSREIFQMLGYKVEQVRQMGNDFLRSAMHPDDVTTTQAHYARLAQSKDGEILDHEYRMKHVNGEWRWIASRDTVFRRQPDGTVQRIVGTARDITERKQMEEAIRKSEAQLRAVIANVPLVLISTDIDGAITLSVGKGLNAMGEQQNESVGKNIFNLYRDHPEVITGIRRALAGETALGVANIGDLVYDAWYSPLYDSEGSITGVLGVSIDITDRVRAEAVLQETLERLISLREIENDLSHSLNLESVLLVAADTVLRLTGASDGFIGLFRGDAIEVVEPIGRYHRGQIFDKTVGIIGRVLHLQEAELVLDVHADPEYVTCLPETRAKMCVPLVYRNRLIGVLNLETSHPEQFTEDAYDFVKLIVGRITVAVDNAQLYELAQQQLMDMHQLYNRVSQLEQLKTDMIRIAAHDLRNPLGQVLGFSELLLEESVSLTEDQHEFIDSIHRGGKKMQKMIGDILSLQRIEAMPTGTQHEVIDLVELTRSLFAESSVKAHQKAQEYQLNVPDTGIKIKGDIAQLREAMDNLIGNAIKYTPEKGSVTVRLKLDGDSGDRAIFEVEDSGIGIPEDQQARLFQPFFRAKTNETVKIEGTGLGLHLVKNIVERHHGKMRFHSIYGRGSAFGFEINTV
jgi:PAS domain S-box-containing protein